MRRRFGEDAEILYLDASREEVRGEHGPVVERIEAEGLLYPVTVLDGEPVYDGAVSYPAILRSVQARLDTG